MAAEFSFHHLWRIPAEPERVFAALAAVDDYPQWWPQIRTAQRIDANTGTAEIRSLLPYTLHLRLCRQVQQPASGRLRVTMSGDLHGWSEFTVSQDPEAADRTLANYRQQVTLASRLLRLGAPVAGPLLRLNHWAMMTAGERGLTGYLNPPRP